jgi:CMP-N-acetylneuraminic acid synthetase
MLRELGGYNEQFNCQDGYDLWLKFIAKHRVLNVNIPLFSYRRHTENLTNNENRILETRQEIKKYALKAKSKTVAIIPIRYNYINGINWPMYEVDGMSIIQKKVEILRKAETVDKIVITTARQEIINHVLENRDLFEGVEIIKRDTRLEAANLDLAPTVDNVLNQISVNQIESVTIVSLEYPFITHREIDECIHTMDLFNADTVISVREENKQFYRHTGEGMTPINDTSSFNKLERESVFIGAGGIISTRINQFKQKNCLLSDKITHVLVSEKGAFCVNSGFYLDLYEQKLTSF